MWKLSHESIERDSPHAEKPRSYSLTGQRERMGRCGNYHINPSSVTHRTLRYCAVRTLPPFVICAKSCSSMSQGLTLVHFSAQLERSVWDGGCAQGLRSPF